MILAAVIHEHAARRHSDEILAGLRAERTRRQLSPEAHRTGGFGPDRRSARVRAEGEHRTARLVPFGESDNRRLRLAAALRIAAA